ncbi:MAG: SEC-C domain-containing protein [Gemmatimonadales bacterium]|nr:SEC-C domain-containing protein [Gemmatimonadales bacterium]MDZ4388312.1 SEC-C domain-containing protein [Gemmatimonadales bacterium]
MTLAGRNDRCPCGSGRKYKHCCLRTVSAAQSTSTYTAADRTNALAKLIRFSQRPQFTEAAWFATELFQLGQPEATQSPEVEEQTMVAFTSWFVFDLDPGADGRGMIASEFLTWSGANLSTAERTWLTRMSESAVRLYEVQQVEPGRGLTLLDLGSDETCWVEERAGSRQIVQWDLLAVRVVPGSGDGLVLEGLPYLFPRKAREAILHQLKLELKEFRRAFPDRDDTMVYKCLAPTFHQLWLDHVVHRPAPILTTVEGDLFAFTKAVFDCDDPDQVTSRLSAHDEFFFDEKDGVFVWIEPDGVHDRVLGRIAVKRRRLTLETTSEARAERCRALLENTFGNAIRYRATATETLDEAMANNQPRADRSAKPPPETQAMLTEFLTEHYRDWPDHPLPALAGRTPRHAARLKTQRAKVVAILKDMEHHMAQDRRNGKPAIDVGWLWDDLGLERPGEAAKSE